MGTHGELWAIVLVGSELLTSLYFLETQKWGNGKGPDSGIQELLLVCFINLYLTQGLGV